MARIEIKKEKSNKRIIALTVVTTIIVLCISFSKYMSTGTTNSTVQIAGVLFDLSSNNILELQMTPVDNNTSFQELNFTIINELEDKKSDVTMSYTIELSSLSNLPLEFELYKLNEETNGYEELELELETGVTVDKFEIKASDKGQSYKIKMYWKEGTDYTSYKYADLLDYVRITVDSEQVD